MAKTVTIIADKTAESGVDKLVYEQLDTVLRECHEHLVGAEVLVVWKENWQPDSEGNPRYWSLRKANDVERQKCDCDLVLTVNLAVWRDESLGSLQLAILDEAMSLVRLMLDKHGEPKEGPSGRALLRTVKPDFCGNYQVLNRRGFYSESLTRLGQTVQEMLDRGLKPEFS